MQVAHIHISRERYDAIMMTMRQGWCPTVPQRKATYFYHILDGERGLCDDCGFEVESVNASTPDELEAIKRQMRH
jgi:hypothetical protein